MSDFVNRIKIENMEERMNSSQKFNDVMLNNTSYSDVEELDDSSVNDQQNNTQIQNPKVDVEKKGISLYDYPFEDQGKVVVLSSVINFFAAGAEALIGIFDDFIDSLLSRCLTVTPDEGDEHRYIQPGTSVDDFIQATRTNNWDMYDRKAQDYQREEAAKRLRENMKIIGIDYADELFDKFYGSEIFSLVDEAASLLGMDRSGKIYGAFKQVDKSAEIALLVALLAKVGDDSTVALALNGLIYGLLEIGKVNEIHYNERLERKMRDVAAIATFFRFVISPPTDADFQSIANKLLEVGLIDENDAKDLNNASKETWNTIINYYFAQLQVEELTKIEESGEVQLSDEELAMVQLEGYLDGLIAAGVSTGGDLINPSNTYIKSILSAAVKGAKIPTEDVLSNLAFDGENSWVQIMLNYGIDVAGIALGDIIGKALNGKLSSGSSKETTNVNSENEVTGFRINDELFGYSSNSATAEVEIVKSDLVATLLDKLQKLGLDLGTISGKEATALFKLLKGIYPNLTIPDPASRPQDFINWIEQNIRR